MRLKDAQEFNFRLTNISLPAAGVDGYFRV
jgi:hypothetical protein